MKPEPREFEKVSTSDFITGTITDIKYEKEHEFKGQHARIAPAVRFYFKLNGYQNLKPTNWMGFVYSEKSTLYSKYLVSLVEGCKPNMEFDLDQLIGLEVKILFKDTPDGKYQNVDTIRPINGKVIPNKDFKSNEEKEEEVPF